MIHNTEQGRTERIVSPESLANAIAQRPISWGTGVLNPNTVYVGSIEGKRTIVEYRKPQPTGIWLDGGDEPLRIPMPGLILIRKDAGEYPTYQIFAVKKRPSDLKVKLYVPPLPNTYPNGTICWGNVSRGQMSHLDEVDLGADWSFLLGSGFNSHSVHQKSKKYKTDVRKLLIELDEEKPGKYPTTDLVSANLTLQAVLK